MSDHNTPCSDLSKLENRVNIHGNRYDELKEDFVDFRATARHEVSTIRDKTIENTNDIKMLREQVSEVKLKIAKMAVVVSMATAIITAALVWLLKSVLGN